MKKKYKYRAVDFQQADWERVREQAGEGRVVFANDVAKEAMVAVLMRPDRTVLETLRWRHPHDTRALVERLAWLGAERVEAVLEPSGTYGDALRRLLSEAGVKVYRVSPKRVHDAAEVYDGVPSLHDPKAAYVIGRLHLEGVSQPWWEPDERRRELRAKLGLLDVYQGQWQEGLNRLEALLARHWPEAAYHLELSSVSLLSLVAHYGDAAAVAGEPEAAGERLRRAGGPGLKPAKIEALLASARTTVGVPCVAAEREALKRLAADLLEARTRCREIEQALAPVAMAQPNLARLAAAVGKTTAVVLYCALGDPAGYPDAQSYAKAAGLNLKERSSGKHKGKLKLTKRGPGVARRYLYFAVLRLIAKEGPAKRWYQAKVARDGGLKGKAIAALMRKLTKALWHVGRGAPFEVHKLFGTPDRTRGGGMSRAPAWAGARPVDSPWRWRGPAGQATSY
jgi:transposase